MQPHIDTHLNREHLKLLHALLAARFGAENAIITSQREVVLVVPAAEIPSTLTFLKSEKTTQFTQLMDICGVDYLGHQPAHPKRFAVVYHLLSLAHNLRLRVKTYVNEVEPVPTAVNHFEAAGWYEREAYDMYGIVFQGHPDLRRILTDYDFVGFPLRKDFPLTGHVEVYFDTAQNRVAYKPVDLPQEFRHFDKVSEWKAMTGNAHLADKDNETFNAEDFK